MTNYTKKTDKWSDKHQTIKLLKLRSKQFYLICTKKKNKDYRYKIRLINYFKRFAKIFAHERIYT